MDVEYKNPHSAQDRIDARLEAASTQRLISQIKCRFGDFEAAEHVEQKRLFGCGTDGRYILFVRNRTGKFEIDPPLALTHSSVGRLLRALISLGAKGSSFTPENLCADFGAMSQITRQTVTALYHAITTTDNEKARTLFAQWRLLFSEVCGYKVLTQRGDAVETLAKNLGITNVDGAFFLFALHTYYSIFIKFLGSEIVSAFSSFTASIIQRCVNASSANALRRVMLRLETGENWKAWGVSNFLEGDLFAWYISAWTTDVADAIKAIALKADEYDPSTLSVEPTESQDLLKQLYQHLIPRSIRHDLGEYYTPDWLASHALDAVGLDGNPDKRVLDPGCGSGTFLVETINRIKSWFDSHRHECGFSETALAQKILTNVVGFDLNPLAVMTSRVNYLIAIRDLIKYAPHVEIPVYLSDSVRTPTAFGRLFTNITQLKTAVGEFLIPAEVSRSSSDIAKYTQIMELCIEEKASADVFLDQCKSDGLPIGHEDGHRALYSQMQQLSIENRNGVWARVIKNSFAPIFSKRFHFVLGNPPWINWQHLPKEYRTDLLPVWKKYNLLTLTGAAAQLGGSKKDLSMLFTYVSVDKYLHDGGRLAFLITQSVLKTQGAGDGFRRFRFEDGSRNVYLRPVTVEDFSAIQVFDGASNRTAMIVLEKSSTRFRYPINYRIWRGIGRIPQDAKLDDVKGRAVVVEAVAEPVIQGRSSSPWLTVPRGTLPVCRKMLGRSAYRAAAGVTTWLNGVYWVEILQRAGEYLTIQNLSTIGRTKDIEQIQARVESRLVYPLIRGEDVFRWNAAPSLHVIIPQDKITREGIPEEEMRRKNRLTYSYLAKFKSQLSNRAGYVKYFKDKGSPFYSIYNVSHETFSPHKVVWRDMGIGMQAAVVSRSEENAPIPEHHVMFIPAFAG